MKAALAAVALMTSPASAGEREARMATATGTFTVAITPEAQAPAPPAGLPTARMGLVKSFQGGLVGEATGTMLSAGTPAPGHVAAYVAIDQFSGTLDGRKGGFLLLHRGTMDGAGTSTLDVEIAPGSGTGELAGIAGVLSIDTRGGGHRYTLSYTLPAGRPASPPEGAR